MIFAVMIEIEVADPKRCEGFDADDLAEAIAEAVDEKYGERCGVKVIAATTAPILSKVVELAANPNLLE